MSPVRRLIVLTLLTLGLSLTGCSSGGGSSASTKTADGNKHTCADFASYSSWLLSSTSAPTETAFNEEGKSVAARLRIDGPTAESATLSHDAAVTVHDFEFDNQQAVGNDMNAVESVCASVGYNLSGAPVSNG